MIRVLIVDDSETQRAVIRAALETDPQLVVVGEACDGVEAVEMTRALQPDIVTMDIQMPRMNGFDAIRQIMSESPRPILAVASTYSDRLMGMQEKVFEAGALAVVNKPQSPAGEDARRLISQVKTMSEVKVVRRRWNLLEHKTESPHPALPPRPQEPPAGGVLPVELVTIGVSTGGPPALQFIFSGLPAGFGVPILVVQHISAGFVSSLASWLNETTPLTCKVAVQNEILKPGTVYFAPDYVHLRVVKPGLVWLDASPAIEGHLPSANALFESAAQNFGPAAVGLIMTGMGADGVRGLKLIREAGGRTLAQDEASSVVFGMPREAIASGAAEEVVSLKDTAARLRALVPGSKKFSSPTAIRR